jgi:uncharacterized protein YukE
MKTFEDYKADAQDLREQLRDILSTLDNLSSHAQTLADCLSDLHSEVDDADTAAMELRNNVEAVKPKKGHRIQRQHFRMLAILNEYGPMHREHVAKLLGMKTTSVDQLACQIRKHHLGDLRSRKGVYTLEAIGDDVRDNAYFQTI